MGRPGRLANRAAKPRRLLPCRLPISPSRPMSQNDGVFFTAASRGYEGADQDPLKAMILQQQNAAQGYFLSTNTSGSFVLVPDSWATSHKRPALERRRK